jgi:hypothetical protein
MAYYTSSTPPPGLSTSQSYTHIMKLSTTFFLLAASVITASPTPTTQDEPAKALQKRAGITDTANIGYAMANGG